MAKEYAVLKHELVPKHELLPEDEVEKLVHEYEIDVRQLPRILNNDPVVREMGGAPGDVLRIVRKSSTAGIAVVYRLVIEG